MRIVEVLNVFGRTRGITPAQVALAWLMNKKPFIVPIPGTTKLSHLEENLRAAEIRFTESEMRELIKEETLTQCVEATEPWELVFGKVVEGPSIVKQGGLYYMFYSANDFRSQDYAVGYATSDSPFGPWRKSEKNPLLHKVEELVGTGHGAPFLDKAGRYRYIFHAHKSQTEVNQRNSYIIDMSLTGKDQFDVFHLTIHLIGLHERSATCQQECGQ